MELKDLKLGQEYVFAAVDSQVRKATNKQITDIHSKMHPIQEKIKQAKKEREAKIGTPAAREIRLKIEKFEKQLDPLREQIKQLKKKLGA